MSFTRGAVRLLFNVKGQQVCALRTLCTQKESAPFQVERLTNEHEGITVFALNRPQTKNAISRQMLRMMTEAVEDVKYDRATRVVIIRSLVPGAFCVGADLKERSKMTLEEVPRFVDAARALMCSLEHLPQPVIAAIDGYALGGGLEMALACDIRVAADSARLGLTETKLAIIPGAGGTQRLPRVIGASAAKELIYTGRIIDGVQAHRLALVNNIVDQNNNSDAAYVLAVNLAQEILQCGPIGVRMAKLAINRGMQCDLETAMEVEKLCYAQVIPTKDRVEALMAFKEKRPPQFKGE